MVEKTKRVFEGLSDLLDGLVKVLVILTCAAALGYGIRYLVLGG